MKTSIFLLVVVLSGCTVRQDRHNQVMNTWLNHHRDQLIKSWGVPSAEQILSDGSAVVEYHKSRVEDRGSIAMPVGTIGGIPMYADGGGSIEQKWCKTTFFVNSQSIIYNWKYQGNDCY